MYIIYFIYIHVCIYIHIYKKESLETLGLLLS